MPDEPMSFVARCPTCDEMYAAITDTAILTPRKLVALIGWLREGAQVARIPSERVRQELSRCGCKS